MIGLISWTSVSRIVLFTTVSLQRLRSFATHQLQRPPLTIVVSLTGYSFFTATQTQEFAINEIR